jgi:poly(hydroxyalkanoate) depolymerase family esterase
MPRPHDRPTHHRTPPWMRRATQLTRSGRVREATALIQRSLGGSPASTGTAPAASARSAGRRPHSGSGVRASGDGPRRVEATVVHTERTADSGPARATSSSAAPTATVGSASTVVGTVTSAAGSRRYRLDVPPGAPTGLIVMLHGCTQDAEDFSTGTRMHARAADLGMLVAYPEQSTDANPSRCWNWFRAEDQARGRGEPSIIAELVRTVVADHAVDRARVFVAGMSAGGAMALVLAAVYPDLFAAVGAHSGLPYRSAHDLPSALQAMKRGGSSSPVPSPVPTIVFHGDADRTVHGRNAEQAVARATAHVSRPHVSEHARIDAGRASTRHVHRAPDGRVLAEAWTVHGLGHAWSGGDPAGSHTEPVGPDASAEMVRFFAEQPPRH